MSATLKIKNSEELGKEVWQMDGCKDWDAGKWAQAIENFADTLQKIYYSADRYYERDIDDYDLYILGDTINLLRAIDIQVEKETT